VLSPETLPEPAWPSRDGRGWSGEVLCYITRDSEKKGLSRKKGNNYKKKHLRCKIYRVKKTTVLAGTSQNEKIQIFGIKKKKGERGKGLSGLFSQSQVVWCGCGGG